MILVLSLHLHKMNQKYLTEEVRILEHENFAAFKSPILDLASHCLKVLLVYTLRVPPFVCSPFGLKSALISEILHYCLYLLTGNK